MCAWKIEDLYRIRGQAARAGQLSAEATHTRITVHMGTCGISSGADKVLAALEREMAQAGAGVELTTSGCAGICNREPLITVERAGQEAVKYANLTPELARRVYQEHVLAGQVPAELAFALGWEQPELAFEGQPAPWSQAVAGLAEVPFFGRQSLWVMRNRGLIQAESLEQYIGRDGYFAAAKALYQMTPQEIVAEVKASGLRGRGGAGFPTGLKWDFAQKSRGEIKYVLCNADEGDPGAFMDRCVLESDPHAVIEGMLIAAKAIGSGQGYIYCRAEYPLAVQMLNLAISQAREQGLLGNNILGSGFSFDLEVYRGAGAFVCGEETALMTSLEGKRGMPRPRPPFPAVAGLWKRPTILNNVETLASVPQIILKGAKTYAGLGTARSRGTKVFAITGDIANVGLVEVPMGISLGAIIHDIGGGIPGGKQFKAVQLGGPSGGCVPAQHLGAPVEYESIQKLGAIMGSGGMIVMDDDKCMVDVARFFMEFCVEESCGKCTPCRVGTRQMLGILTRICQGQGREGDIETLERWADIIMNTALCGLGQTAPNPVLSTLRYFRHEYEAHIRQKRCPAVACASLFASPCQHACPAGMDVPRYLALLAQGEMDQAYRTLLETNPFPSVCGRVCDHRCELKCRRRALDGALNIRNLKRYITDHAARPALEAPGLRREERVAVIGGGPSGLACARDLALLGYPVTVFEAMAQPGGMLRYGIPAYRLPRAVLDAEIQAILDLGVELICPVKVDPALWERIRQEYQAVYLAVGAWQSAKLGVPGEDLPGVVGAIEFLRQVNQEERGKVGSRVAVVGGGNSAIDAARSARRLGAEEVTILYRRQRPDMPAQDEEIEAALHEGVKIEFLVAPIRLQEVDGRVGKVICQRMSLGEFDQSGRRRPLPIPGREFALEVDLVVAAVGQQTELPFRADDPAAEVKVSPAGLVGIRDKYLTRAAPGLVFAGGDVVTGPATVIEAIAAGRAAAREMDVAICRRSGRPSLAPAPAQRPSLPLVLDPEAQDRPRAAMPELAASARVAGFMEVELGLASQAAAAEANRCLRCDLKDLPG